MDMLLSCCLECWSFTVLVSFSVRLSVSVSFDQADIQHQAASQIASGDWTKAVEVNCQKAGYHATTRIEAKQKALVYGVLYADVHVTMRIRLTFPS